MVDVIGIVMVVACGLSVVWNIGISDWWTHRKLIKMARTYGIEVIPGEDDYEIRRMIKAKRDMEIK